VISDPAEAARFLYLNCTAMELTAAVFGGPDNIYRYELTRVWDDRSPQVLFVMLNPSTADSRADDPTIRRCRDFARDWNCGGLTVANLFALRATDPKQLARHADPVGEDNDSTLARLARSHPFVVVAWGAGRTHVNRGRLVAAMFERAQCLGVTRAGDPRHPLYVRRDTALSEWRGMSEAKLGRSR
jgi:hypothetical protein